MPEQGAAEREIVARLAERAGRRSGELAHELRLAAVELPVDHREIVAILPALERRYGVPLVGEPLPPLALQYVAELALAIRGRLGASLPVTATPSSP